LVFSKLPGGYLFGMLFFILLVVAALTSTMSLLEVPVAYFIDEKKWSRARAALLMGSIAFILGIPSALSSGGVRFFTKIDFMNKMHIVFGNISLAVGALLISVFVGWVWGVKKALKEIDSGCTRFTVRPLWIFSLKYLSPAAIIVILIFIKTLLSG
jgi:NSS family neurotransmitter:Na+ symporter